MDKIKEKVKYEESIKFICRNWGQPENIGKGENVEVTAIEYNEEIAKCL